MSDKIKAVVQQGYDDVSYAYRSDSDDNFSEYFPWLEELSILLSSGDAVLDLGCGCGVPTSKKLASNFKVTGVDISSVQIGRAQRLVPDAHFICADMSEINFESARFSAVVAFYSIIHIPLEEQPEFFNKISKWLKMGGYLMAIVGHTAWTGIEDNWLVPGATMFWSHADVATYEQWLYKSGFSVLWSRFIPEGDSGHSLILAQKS
jgi:cyclopropane fatty-acyl-phospholipid synthase-like methyltransferase